MRCSVGAEIVIEDCTDGFLSYLESKLVFDNPEYEKKTRMGLWTGNTPQKLSLIERHGNDVTIPFGMLADVFRHKSMFDDFIPMFTVQERFKFESSVTPYGYQERAIESALNKKHGVIVAPCGAGKTQIGLEIAKELGHKCLWITHTQDLLNQSMERAKSCFEGLEDKDFGTITGGKIDIGRIFTFATVQTLSKINLDRYRGHWNVIIVDECHHCCGTPTRMTMFYKCLSNLKARYKFGLTATPKRSDGLIECMYAIIGEKIHEITQEEVKETTCPVEVLRIDTKRGYDFEQMSNPDGTVNWSKFVDVISEDFERNEKIVEDVINSKGSCLVLTDRVKHVYRLSEMLEEKGIECRIAIGKNKKTRGEAISDLREGRAKVLVATYQLAKEGLDIPSLRNLFLATPVKNQVTVQQSAGRVARKYEGKEKGVVHDYVDDFLLCERYWVQRRRVYKRLGFSFI